MVPGSLESANRGGVDVCNLDEAIHVPEIGRETDGINAREEMRALLCASVVSFVLKCSDFGVDVPCWRSRLADVSRMC